VSSAWLDSWGNSWGDSWGPITVDPNAMVGSGTFGLTAVGTLTNSAVEGSATFGLSATGTLTSGTQPETVVGGGGYLPKYHPWIHSPRKSKLYEVADLEPELADAVIEAVATVVEKRTVQNKDLETAQAEKELRAYLKSQEQRWKKEYAQLILLEYERREQEYEDAQIAMLLFDM